VIALIQRVEQASVSVDGQIVSRIGPGLVALIGVERGDGEAQAQRLAERVLGYRVFTDGLGKMNLALSDIAGELLAVPQFTLAADTRGGARPGFSAAAAPGEGERLFERFVAHARMKSERVQTGRFGAHMKVTLVNDGPVTFWLQAAPVHAGSEVR
jgi:D-tyrosyl-tRNA(Tyr) deacylase